MYTNEIIPLDTGQIFKFTEINNIELIIHLLFALTYSSNLALWVSFCFIIHTFFTYFK